MQLLILVVYNNVHFASQNINQLIVNWHIFVIIHALFFASTTFRCNTFGAATFVIATFIAGH